MEKDGGDDNFKSGRLNEFPGKSIEPALIPGVGAKEAFRIFGCARFLSTIFPEGRILLRTTRWTTAPASSRILSGDC